MYIIASVTIRNALLLCLDAPKVMEYAHEFEGKEAKLHPLVSEVFIITSIIACDLNSTAKGKGNGNLSGANGRPH